MKRIAFQTESEVTAALPHVVQHIQADRLIAYPTETVYGFGGAVTETAAARLRALKHREAHKPFLLLITDIEQAPGVQWTPAALTLARLFWPGPLTLAVPAHSASFPPGVVSEDGMVALRATPHEPIRRLIAALRAPISSTSANAPRQPPARSGDEAVAALAMLEGVDVLVLDGGVIPRSRPSTLVACDEQHVRVLREGVITHAELRQRLQGTGFDVE